MTKEKDTAQKANEWAGQTLGRKYLVKRAIGEGGMGVVLEAENTAIHRPVAIKLLHSVLVKNETSVKRFENEAKAAAGTGHAHIVEIFDLGRTEEGAPFIVMELLEGGNLQELLRVKKVLDPKRASRICVQVLSALSAVHAKGIVHRDLKPANVILIEKGKQKEFVKLVDFGISKIQEHGREQSHLTATGVVMGTPHYMSPEQARGEKAVDYRADLYAVGAMLYRCVCGKVPYPGKNYNQILARILAQPPPSVRELRPDVPPLLVEIIEKAMARHPEKRYQTAAAFAADLADFCGMDISIPHSSAERAAQEADSVRDSDDATPALKTAPVEWAAMGPPQRTPPTAEGPASPQTPPSSGGWKPAAGVSAVPSAVSRSELLSSEQHEDEPDAAVSATVRIKGGGAQPVQAAPAKPAAPTNIPSLVTPRKKNRWGLAGIAGAVVLLIAAVAVALWASGWWDDAADKPAGGPAGTAKPLRFALGQHLSRKKRIELYGDVAAFLQKRLERKVELLTPSQVTKLGQKLEVGKFDLLAVSPLLYVKLKQDHPNIPVLATARFRRNRTYQGLILARADGNIHTLKDLRGKRFCWVSKHSTSGYLFPRLAMREAGLDPDEIFSWTTQAQQHVKALELLEKGTCDAAAVVNMIYYRRKVTGQISTPLRIVAPTAPIPEDPVCASPKLDSKTRARIQEALLEFDAQKHASSQEASKRASRVTSFVEGKDSTYDTVRKALAAEAKANAESSTRSSARANTEK